MEESSSDERVVFSRPEGTFDNVTSWRDTLFYDPGVGSLDTWLDENSPSKTLGKQNHKWLGVINPQENIIDYKRKWNRQSQTSQEIVNAIRPLQDTIEHDELLNIAVENNILNGFWFIICDSNTKLDRHWSHLVKGFYNDDSNLQYSRIECCRDNTGTEPVGGVIFILNEKFTDQTTIVSLAEKCNSISEEKNLDLGNMYYKLAFYTDVGMYNRSSYILTSHAKYGISYMENVKEWFRNS